MNRFSKYLLMISMIVLAMYILKPAIPHKNTPEPMDYSVFYQKVTEGLVQSGKWTKDNHFVGELTNGKKINVVLPTSAVAQSRVEEKMLDNKVDLKYDKPVLSDLVQSLIYSFLPMLLFLALFYFVIIRQAQAGGNQAMSFGRSKAKRVTENVPKVTFEDVAGVEEAKQELIEVVEFLRNPKKFQALGAKIPKGVLLLGPPGSGKTLLARAIAGEAGVPFFHISGSDFVEMFVGVGASRVRDLFETAKANRPSLIFIDEIDAVGRQRGAGLGGGHDEREQTLNQLLVEMDGFDPNAGVILIAATNRPDVLDPALLRPGRFDRRVTVDNPDAVGREAILKVHSRGKPLDKDVNLTNLARRTPGFSGADLANLVNEAALLAARHEKTKIGMSEFESSIDRVVAGPERKSRLINDKEKEMVAYHEVGHAIVLELLPLADPVHKISILPRGMALGYTMQLPLQDKYLTTKSELLDDIAGLLGGRAAERFVFSEVTTGANSDLDRASEIARAMVCEFGMSDTLGPVTLGKRHGNPFLGRDLMEDRNYSEEVAITIDREVKKIIDEAYVRAEQILVENKEKMVEIVGVLLEKETLEREEFEMLIYGRKDNPAEDNTPGGPAPEADDAKQAPSIDPNIRLEPGVA
ncbi:MAG: ATP-dependent zinc metalloprotease FtsH [Armatimonadota bacterium]